MADDTTLYVITNNFKINFQIWLYQLGDRLYSVAYYLENEKFDDAADILRDIVDSCNWIWPLWRDQIVEFEGMTDEQVFLAWLRRANDTDQP